MIKDDVKSITGANIRTIFRETEIDPRELRSFALKHWRVYERKDDWSVPLLRNLLEVRAGNWIVSYDEDGSSPPDEDIEAMIEVVCVG